MQYDCNHIYTVMPDENLKVNKLGESEPANILKFQNYQNQLIAPFVVYADFESLLIPVNGAENDPQKSFTETICKHVPYAWAYYVKSNIDDSWSKFKTYQGIDAAKEFVTQLENDAIDIYNKYWKIPKTITNLTADQLLEYERATECFICNKPFTRENCKCRDHCHITGDFRGAIHKICNINFRLAYRIPVIFHNLSNYDAHLFIKQLAHCSETLDVIPISVEKYVMFSRNIPVDVKIINGLERKINVQLRFLDSFRFMSASLDKLSQNLDSEQCVELRKFFPEDNQFSLLRKKGIFPYSYMDDIAKLNEPNLPPREEFLNDFTGEIISVEDYDRAKRIWDSFECQTLGDYSNMYLKCDVLLLADVFENFRKLCLKVYGLDPAHYVTAPGLTWDAMLKYTHVHLELIVDYEKYTFFRRSVRGGVSSCVKRKSIANNEFLSNYDPKLPKNFIMYLDATNLYGHSMRAHLPLSNFEWLSAEEIQNFDVTKIDDQADVGYVIEVDLHYPTHLHDLHNDLPFCPENILPQNSKFKETKLIPNLFDKCKYVIHYRNLKQCLLHGLEIIEIRRVLKFKQSPWLRDYIDLNTSYRNKARNKFEKDFFKLMNNGVFGKSMENVDKRRNIKLINHWENIGRRWGMERYVAKPNFKRFVQFDREFFAVEMSKTKVTYNKPIYVGFTILDISKTVIYRFFYDVLKKEFGDDVSLLYTDTDSILISVKTNNFYEHIRNNPEEYDTSNYDIGNIHGIVPNKSLVGRMKDEYAGTPIKNFYGSGAKAYCVNVGGDIIKRAKGVKKYVINKILTDTDFKTVAEQSDASIFCKMILFRSKLHDMYTMLTNKLALTSRDDKRYINADNTSTLAWGHYSIPEQDVDDDALNRLVQIMLEEL